MGAIHESTLAITAAPAAVAATPGHLSHCVHHHQHENTHLAPAASCSRSPLLPLKTLVTLACASGPAPPPPTKHAYARTYTFTPEQAIIAWNPEAMYAMLGETAKRSLENPVFRMRSRQHLAPGFSRESLRSYLDKVCVVGRWGWGVGAVCVRECEGGGRQ